MKQVKKQETNTNELKNQLARALADYDNLRKRTELEKEVWGKFSSERILTRLLPILDNLEVTLKHNQDQGLAIAVSEFKKILNEEGMEEIVPKLGEAFDENTQEAVDVVSGKDKGKVAEVVLPGWKFKNGPVIRVAKVKVYDNDKNKEVN